MACPYRRISPSIAVVVGRLCATPAVQRLFAISGNLAAPVNTLRLACQAVAMLSGRKVGYSSGVGHESSQPLGLAKRSQPWKYAQRPVIQ